MGTFHYPNVALDTSKDNLVLKLNPSDQTNKDQFQPVWGYFSPYFLLSEEFSSSCGSQGGAAATSASPEQLFLLKHNR